MIKKYVTKQEKICIVGLGYVGLPIALEFARKYKVVGFDINQKKTPFHAQKKQGFSRGLFFRITVYFGKTSGGLVLLPVALGKSSALYAFWLCLMRSRASSI